jgi:hypothetical protein
MAGQFQLAGFFIHLCTSAHFCDRGILSLVVICHSTAAENWPCLCAMLVVMIT